MNVTDDLRLIEHRIIELYCQAERHLLQRFKRPRILLNLKGESAGQAWPEKKLLRFNPVLLRENKVHFLEQTVAHEVAHLLAHELFGSRIRAHGKEWQSIMIRVFGLSADRCHSYDTARSARRSFIYSCQCSDRTTALSTTRHNRASKGIVYLCTTCRSPLEFVEKIQTTSS